MLKVKLFFFFFFFAVLSPHLALAGDKAYLTNKSKEQSECVIAQSAIEAASRLRGLSVKREVPCQLKSRVEVEKFLRDTVSKRSSRDRIEKEGEVYRLLGIIPKDYDYFNGVISLYTDQLGGYYDIERKCYGMADWMPSAMQMPIAVHELTHALQDQHFDLVKITHVENGISDELLARTAVIEGDATAVMLDYARELSGQPRISQEDSVSAFMVQNITGAMLSPSFHHAPATIQASLIFPYVSGLNFVHVMLKKGGFRQVDEVLLNLPKTTAEILHPKRYLAEKKPFEEVSDPRPVSGIELAQNDPVYSDRFGEFLTATWLSTWLGPREGSVAASGWRGDKLALYFLKQKKEAVLLWELVFDDEKDSTQFFEAVSRAYGQRFGRPPVSDNKQSSVFEETIFGRVTLEKASRSVKLQIGPTVMGPRN